MTRLRLIRGGKSATAAQIVALPPRTKFDDPISVAERARATEVARAVIRLAREPERGNVATSLVASVEWALAANVPWSDFVQIARNEFIHAKARRKPGPVPK